MHAFDVSFKMTKVLTDVFHRMANYLAKREHQNVADMVAPDQEAIMVSYFFVKRSNFPIEILDKNCNFVNFTFDQNLNFGTERKFGKNRNFYRKGNFREK